MRISAYLFQRSFNYISTTSSLFEYAKFQIKSPIYAVVFFPHYVKYCAFEILCQVKISAQIVPTLQALIPLNCFHLIGSVNIRSFFFFQNVFFPFEFYVVCISEMNLNFDSNDKNVRI